MTEIWELEANQISDLFLKKKISSIEIVDSPGDDGSAIELDGNDSDVRDKLRTIVSRAVDTDDGNAAVPITVTLTGNYAKMLGDDAVDGDGDDAAANPITLTAVRDDQVTLTIDTTNHTFIYLRFEFNSTFYTFRYLFFNFGNSFFINLF